VKRRQRRSDMLCAGRFYSEKERLGLALAGYRLMARWRWLVPFSRHSDA